MDLKISIYIKLIHLKILRLFKLNKETKKPNNKEKNIDIIEIDTVIDNPLNKNCKLEYPFSNFGFKIYQPQL